MNILVINGDCIQTNSSANLCHLSYINGLIEAGHKVSLLCADGKDYKLDESLTIPAKVTQYVYYGVSIYEKLSLKRKSNNTNIDFFSHVAVADTKKRNFKEVLINKLKKFVLSLYGVHSTYICFVNKAKHFKCKEKFDYVISISTPVTSHLLAYKLIKKKHIKYDNWIQIWEDPWWGDIYGFNNEKSKYKEERRLLSFAEHICYVSPLTLKNRQEVFPESADKMFWQPLPSYYVGETVEAKSHNVYGYFGDYAPASRELKQFYLAAKDNNIEVNICGNPSNLFEATNSITIHPRLPLNKLKVIEDKTNVLIFLCNRQGGQIPGKIYQYSATNKTILFILDGTEEEKKVLKEYFSKYNRYVFCENTVEDISRAIKDIESGNIGDVKNVPLDCFNSKDIIQNILDCKNG